MGLGKFIVVNVVVKVFFDKNICNYVLDGDNVCFGLNKNLGFFVEDCIENICCIGEVFKLFVDSG